MVAMVFRWTGEGTGVKCIMSEADIGIGARIESDGHYATIRFVGAVPPTSGVWVGVEWDDPSRGKHDGNYEGTRYFTTDHPTAGSFLRLKKCNLGMSFMDALQEKYGRIEDDNELVKPEELYVLGANQKTQVELVGAQKVNIKQSHFHDLKEVGLNGLYVNGAGMAGEIASKVPNIRQLNLAVSLLSSWTQVVDIASQMPLLQELDVSSNRLQFPENGNDAETTAVSVETLYANRLSCDWNQANAFVLLFKHLKNLHVCYNRIQSLESPCSSMKRLTLLNLEGNPIQDWTKVLCLAELSLLETLILNQTDLGEISFPDGQVTRDCFPKLVSLSLSNNRISEWSSINELNKLESLTVLRFLKNPLVTTAGGTLAARQVIIAKLKKIKMLNSMEVTASERRDAEIDYINLYGLEWKSAGGIVSDPSGKLADGFVKAHPRYQELVKKHGAAEDSEMKKNESTALKNSLIKVKIKSPLLGDQPALEKKLPTTMTVQKLKALVQRLFRQTGQSNLRVTCVSGKKIGPEIELDNNLRDLSFYSVAEGDTIYVHW